MNYKLEESIRKIAEKEELVEYTVDKNCVSANGTHYLSMLYEYTVTGTTVEGTVKTLDLFVKEFTDSGLNMFSLSTVFANEMFAYKELSKLFVELQEQANIPLKNHFKMVKSYEQTDAETIIMDDVTKRGFTTLPRMDVPSLEFVEMSLQQLAKLHALSFVIKERKPEYFDRKIGHLKYPLNYDEHWLQYIKGIKDVTMRNVDEIYKDNLHQVFKDMEHKFKEYMSDESIQVCLCHGDYRTVNIMTKMHNNVVLELLPIDYQLMYYGSPAFDFLYFIYLGTDREFRKSHMANLKDLYFDTLRQFLGYFELDVDVVYPREQFDKVFNEKRDFGLMMALLVVPLAFVDENQPHEFNEESARINVDNRYKERMRGVLEDFVEFGYL